MSSWVIGNSSSGFNVLTFYLFSFLLVIVLVLIIYRIFYDNVLLYPVKYCNNEYEHPKTIETLTDFTPNFNPSLWLDREKEQLQLISRISSAGNQFKIIPKILTSNWSFSNIKWINLKNNSKILDKNIYPVYNGKQTVEDIRLFDKNIGIGTSTTDEGSTPVIVKWLGSNKYKIARIKAKKWSNLFGNAEKNWIIFKDKGRLILHTHTYPKLKLFLLKINTNPFSCEIVDQISDLKIKNYFPALTTSFKNLRGTTPWILWKGTAETPETYLTLFRTKTYLPRITHRSFFVELSASDFSPIRYSSFICLSRGHEPIQFICGMVTYGDLCIISLGVNDKEARVISIEKDEINKLLAYQAKEPLYPKYEILKFPTLITGDFEPFANFHLEKLFHKSEIIEKVCFHNG